MIPAGMVVSTQCIKDCIKKDMIDPFTEPPTPLKDKDIIPLRVEGTGFAAKTDEKALQVKSNSRPVAMVAANAGWTITTPLLFSRAARFHGDLRMHRFPGKAFARTLALMSTPDCSRSVVELVDAEMRDLIRQHVIEPLHARSVCCQQSKSIGLCELGCPFDRN